MLLSLAYEFGWIDSSLNVLVNVGSDKLLAVVGEHGRWLAACADDKCAAGWTSS